MLSSVAVGGVERAADGAVIAPPQVLLVVEEAVGDDGAELLGDLGARRPVARAVVALVLHPA